MKRPFNKYFIGLIFVLCVVFIPSNKVHADVSYSCLNWVTYTQYDTGCDPFDPRCNVNNVVATYKYCSQWDPLGVYITLNGYEFGKGVTFKADAYATYANTTNSYINEVLVVAVANGISHTIMDTIFDKTSESLFSSNTYHYGDIYYKNLHGSANFTTPSTAGSYSLTYQASSRDIVSYTNTCTSGYTDYNYCPDNDPWCQFGHYSQWVCTGYSSTPVYRVSNKSFSGSVPYVVVDALTATTIVKPTSVVAGGQVSLSWSSTGAKSCYCYYSNGGGNCFAGYSGDTTKGKIDNITINSANTFNVVCSNYTSQQEPYGDYYHLSMNGGPHPWDHTQGSVALNPVNSAGSIIPVMNTYYQVDEIGNLDSQESLNEYRDGWGFDHFIDPATGKVVNFTYIPPVQ